jgi:hypothetical protein
VNGNTVILAGEAGNFNGKFSPKGAQRIPGIKYIKFTFYESALRAPPDFLEYATVMIAVSPECAALLPGYACCCSQRAVGEFRGTRYGK